MKNVIKKLAVLAFSAIMVAPSYVNAQEATYLPPRGKEIYIPRDLKDNDFTKESSKWSYARMAYTNDVAVFWEKDFGGVLGKAPELDGHNMKVDINNLLYKLQSYYDFYKNQLKFVKPGSKTEKYRMMVMINYSLEGTAYGGDYDGTIGALWITPNRVQDTKLNCIAHELGHSFQSQIGCDGTGESWGGGGIFEMTSQWMLWQVNQDWMTEENYHWKGFIENMNLRFLAFENIYHSPFVLEFWAMKHGVTVMGDLFREGKKGEDPASTYMRMFHMSVGDMNRQMVECYSRLLTFDYPRLRKTHQKFSCELVSPCNYSTKKMTYKNVTDYMKTNAKGKVTIVPKDKKFPQTWGFNVVELPKPDVEKTTIGELKGLNLDANATYGTQIVYVNKDGGIVGYEDMQFGSKIKFKIKGHEAYSRVFLVVVGCPKNTYTPFIDRNGEQAKEVTFPYEILLKRYN